MSVQLLGNLVVALLGLATSANWLVRGDARRLTRIRAEAELVGLLHESDARDALVRKVAADVLSHIDLSRSARARSVRNSAIALLAVEVMVALASATLIVIALVTDPTPHWMTYGIWSATGVLVVLTVTLAFLGRRNEQVTGDSEKDAENDMRISDLIARVSGHSGPDSDRAGSIESDEARIRPGAAVPVGERDAHPPANPDRGLAGDK